MVKLHPNPISRILKAAGIPKSETWSTRIRGWHHSSHGFKVITEWGEKRGWRRNRRRRHESDPMGWATTVADRSVVKEIRIDWRFGDWHRGDRDSILNEWFAKIKTALEAAGYTAEEITRDNGYSKDRWLKIGVKAA